MLDLARELAAARAKHESNQAFGERLHARLGNSANTLEPHERTALILIGQHADTAGPLLARTERRSVRTFVDAR